MCMEEYKSESGLLFLRKSPEIKSWSLFVGIVSFGLGAAYYGADVILLKIIYIAGSVILGLTFLDEWEDFVADKTKNELILRRANVFQKLFHRFESRCVRLHISDVINVRVNRDTETEPQIVLILKSGMVIPICETPTNSTTSNLRMTAERIESFLQLNRIENISSSKKLFPNESMDSSDSENEVYRNVVSLH